MGKFLAETLLSASSIKCPNLYIQNFELCHFIFTSQRDNKWKGGKLGSSYYEFFKILF